MSNHTQHTNQAYIDAIAACKAWSAALRTRYGKRAGDMRYTKEGQSGEFAPFVAEFHRTRDIWLKALGTTQNAEVVR